MDFYRNVAAWGDKLLVRGVENGKRIQMEEFYKPTMYIRNKEGSFENIHGDKFSPKTYNGMKDAKKALSRYSGVAGFSFHGMEDFKYAYLNEVCPGHVDYNMDNIRIVSIDIETMSDDGFPNIETADKAVTVVTLGYNGTYYVITDMKYKPHKDDVKLISCANEKEILSKFISLWKKIDPDVVTGWNVELFDMKYMVNRIRRILGRESELSPWGIILDKKVRTMYGREDTSYNIYGIEILDYMALDKKFSYTPRESYKLDHVAEVELNEKKLDYSEYGSLHNFYVKNPQKYVEYNVHDTRLIDMLEEKSGLISLALSIAYSSKTNYSDCFSPTKLWDVIIHNYLLDKNIVIPTKSDEVPYHRYFTGGYVKQPLPGNYEWVVSFDLNSLYPHLIMQYNISPDKFVTKLDDMDIEKALIGVLSEDQLIPHDMLVKDDLSLSPNGCLWKRDNQGFLGILMEKMYLERKEFKNKMIEEDIQYQKTKKKDHKDLSHKYDKIQMAKKILLNSAYGALGNKYFRWFDVDSAEAITTGGQLSIRWIGEKLNEYINKVVKTNGVDYIIASDTDSVYINLGPIVDKHADKNKDTNDLVDYVDNMCKKALEPYIDKQYKILSEKMNVYSQKMVMKREVIAARGIWRGKKNYVLYMYDKEGVRYQKPKLKVMGLESVKSSTPKLIRDKMTEALEIIMGGTNEDYFKFVAKFKKEYKTLSFVDVAFPRSVNGINKNTISKDKMKWEQGTPMHVKAAIAYNVLVNSLGLENQYEYIKDGDKIKFCHLKRNPHGVEVIATNIDVLPDEFGLTPFIDYDKQFDKSFLNPINKLIGLVEWEKTDKTVERLFV